MVLDCAEELLAAGGIDAARVEDIAAAAGIAPRTLYSVFASKTQIVAETVERRRVALIEYAAQRAAAGTTAFEMLRLSVRGASEFFLQHPNYLKMELFDSRAWADENASTSITWYHTFEAHTRLFTRAIAEGEVRPGEPKAFARALLAIQQSQLAHWVSEGMARDREAVIADIESLLVHAFAAQVPAVHHEIGHGSARHAPPPAR
ncbi:hypothetical protein AWC13_12090 [Mycobacterium kubicae]|nr:hypothetical protein AWC13_12090 [Mycobacterium kubicae]